MNGDDEIRFLDESSRKEYVEALLRNGFLQGASEGIAKLVLDKGEATLSDPQRNVYDTFILGHKVGRECPISGPIDEWGDRAFALDDPNGYCPNCRDHMAKDSKFVSP